MVWPDINSEDYRRSKSTEVMVLTSKVIKSITSKYVIGFNENPNEHELNQGN